MIVPFLVGVVAAMVVALPRILWATFPAVPWSHPAMLLLVIPVGILVWRFQGDGIRYNGVTDLLVHIHSPSQIQSNSTSRWSGKALLAFLLTLLSGVIGPEGPAIATAQALELRRRSRFFKWFEQQRRSDSASALAAGVAAAFGAPFAALIATMELGMGGRVLGTVITVIAAWISTETISDLAGLERELVKFAPVAMGWKEWFGVGIIAVGVGLLAGVCIRFFRYCQDSANQVFEKKTWLRILVGILLLFLVASAFPAGHLPSWLALGHVLGTHASVFEAGLYFSSLLLSLALVFAIFGSVGVFWPLFAMGGLAGYAVFHLFQDQVVAGFSGAAALVGAVAFLGAVLGVPVSAGILGFEFTHNSSMILPALAAALIGTRVREWLSRDSLLEGELKGRGVHLVEGRTAEVLESIRVKNTMVTDFETVNERDTVVELHSRLAKFRYPFIPVVNAQGTYLGLLTADLIQEAWRVEDPENSNSPLSKLLEAKDLLYRARAKVPTVLVTESLLAAVNVFANMPCVPVLDEHRRVAGLLFVFHVRQSYDSEVVHRSLGIRRAGESEG